VLGVCFAWTPDALPKLRLCWFANLTGFPCPGCGITRSLCCIAHGRFAEAWLFNPFGYVLFAGLVVFALRPLVLRLFPALDARALHGRAVEILPIALVAAMTLFGLWRLAHIQQYPYLL